MFGPRDPGPGPRRLNLTHGRGGAPPPQPWRLASRDRYFRSGRRRWRKWERSRSLGHKARGGGGGGVEAWTGRGARRNRSLDFPSLLSTPRLLLGGALATRPARSPAERPRFSPVFHLRLDLTPPARLVLRPSNCRSWDISASIITSSGIGIQIHICVTFFFLKLILKEVTCGTSLVAQW
ncbi:ras-related protein Rab-7a isoform X3 [Lagenorhynchus albirostris]|uniref:ras-related protein Rab-7a isoform X3 n=1 Tax=Lagenorhynchus albirostris TaxID=27610 RepID=UPI0028ED4D9F|nr:ras-related protein Rab-7a isoform X3 [Lagenorhynchus albirostris]